MMRGVFEYLKTVKKYVDHAWYPIALAGIACIDIFILVVPLDALFIASVIAAPKRWITLSIFTAVGFTLGCLGFGLLIHHVGWPVVEGWFPEITKSVLWIDSQIWVSRYGLWAIFGMGLMPIGIHPILGVAVLAKVPLDSITAVILISRLIKYGVLGWVATHSPRLLSKLAPSTKDEVKEILKHD